MDSFCESMDLYRIVTTNPDYESWLQKGSIRALRKNPGFVSYRGSRIQSFFTDSPVFTNLTNPYESLVLWHEMNPYESLRFLSWIRFVGLFLKDSFCGFVSWKQKSQITRFILIRKVLYTNPASLIVWLSINWGGSQNVENQNIKGSEHRKYF
jgi:hypothetical protein